MPNLAATYLNALKKISLERNIKDFAVTFGATKDDIEALRRAWPDVPQSLVDILSELDGTYYRKYGDEEVCLVVFGGIMPYYLNSVAQILEYDNRYSIADIYGEEYAGEIAGKGIDPKRPLSQMLHFSDCTNNGGSSSLYIDFNPAKGGLKGQIVRFVHDPDEYSVIAPDFDSFLQDNLESDFDFVEEEEDRPENPLFTLMIEKLKAGDPAGLDILRGNLGAFYILNVATQAPTPDVLRVYMAEMERLYAIRDEIAPSGYKYGEQYSYLARNFVDFSSVFLKDEDLKKDVAAFARQTKDATLIHTLKLEQSDAERQAQFRDNCTFDYVQSRYRELDPERFYDDTELVWKEEGFYEYFGIAAVLDPVAEGRLYRLDSRWKERLQSLSEPAHTLFVMLADFCRNEEDIELLKNRLNDPSAPLYENMLGWFVYALQRVGDDALDRHLDWAFGRLLAALEANRTLFSYGFNDDSLCLDYAIRKNSDGFSAMIWARPQRSLQLLAQIAPMLTNEKAKKMCAKLERMIKKDGATP